MSSVIKWRFAQVISGLQLIICLLLLCSLTYVLWEDRRATYNTTDTIITVIAYAILIFIISFTVFMVFAIQKHYPDKIFSSAVNRLFIINWFLYLVATLCVAMVFYFGLRDVLRNMEQYKDYPYPGTNKIVRRQFIYLAILLAWIMLMVCLLVLSIKFRKLIRKNYATKQAAEIEMLGSGNI